VLQSEKTLDQVVNFSFLILIPTASKPKPKLRPQVKAENISRSKALNRQQKPLLAPLPSGSYNVKKVMAIFCEQN
jgi:hypothetical protein